MDLELSHDAPSLSMHFLHLLIFSCNAIIPLGTELGWFPRLVRTLTHLALRVSSTLLIVDGVHKLKNYHCNHLIHPIYYLTHHKSIIVQ